MQQRKVYTCPNAGCRQIVPATATICPSCGQRLMAVTAATKQPTGGGTNNPAAVAQAQSTEKSKFPPVKVGALIQITDSNHQRITPFISVEVFKLDLEQQKVILCFDAGVAEDAIFGAAGVRGIIPDVPYFGGFLFGMFDFRRTVKKWYLGDVQPHFCFGLGVTLGGF
jgi:hypothetical protein